MTRQAAAAWIREDPQAADKVFRELMSASTDTRWAVQNGMFTFACPTAPRAPPHARKRLVHPPELDCAFESICETCTFFQTSIEFRPAHAAQRDDAAARHQDHPRAAVHLAARTPRPGRLMTRRPPLRLARPGQLPAPSAGPDSLQILDQAIDQLARLRTAYWLGDSGVRLHALASLIAQAEQLLPQAVHDARDQELTGAEIGELLGITAATAPRRYHGKP